MIPGGILGLWPVAILFGAVLLRLLEAEVRRDSSARDRLLLELLRTASEVLVLASGVGFALLFGAAMGRP